MRIHLAPPLIDNSSWPNPHLVKPIFFPEPTLQPAISRKRHAQDADYKQHAPTILVTRVHLAYLEMGSLSLPDFSYSHQYRQLLA